MGFGLEAWSLELPGVQPWDDLGQRKDWLCKLDKDMAGAMDSGLVGSCMKDMFWDKPFAISDIAKMGIALDGAISLWSASFLRCEHTMKRLMQIL